jgi:outer membrane murein-binding lipoprotein Lpp
MATRQPWTPIDMDVTDKTARLSVLEIQQRHISKELENHSKDLRDLSTEVKKLTSTIDKLDHQLPSMISEVKAATSQLTSFRNDMMEDQLEQLRKKHDKDLRENEEKTKLSGKIHLLWALGAAIATIVVGVLVRILSIRFGG